jgi:hypothetical protein
MVLGRTHGFVSAGPEDTGGALQEFVGNFTYVGIFVVLLLGSLGVPIPEEMPIIAAAVLSHEGIVRWLVLPVCLLGVLSGDVTVGGAMGSSSRAGRGGSSRPVSFAARRARYSSIPSSMAGIHACDRRHRRLEWSPCQGAGSHPGGSLADTGVRALRGGGRAGVQRLRSPGHGHVLPHAGVRVDLQQAAGCGRKLDPAFDAVGGAIALNSGRPDANGRCILAASPGEWCPRASFASWPPTTIGSRSATRP